MIFSRSVVLSIATENKEICNLSSWKAQDNPNLHIFYLFAMLSIKWATLVTHS